MLDRRFIAARTRPPAPVAAGDALPRGWSIGLAKPETRISLRVRPASDLSSAAGLRLDQPINRCVTIDERWSARLGPDEWLIGGPEADIDEIERGLASGLGNRAHALVDVSHRNATFEIVGPTPAHALNAGCPLDLSDRAFPAGAATRTLLGKVEIVLVRPDNGPRYRVECWRSYATYVHGFLVEAVHGLASS